MEINNPLKVTQQVHTGGLLWRSLFLSLGNTALWYQPAEIPSNLSKTPLTRGSVLELSPISLTPEPMHLTTSTFPGGDRGKEPTCQCGRQKGMSSIPGSGKSTGGGHGNPLQYSGLETPMNKGVWQVTIHRVTKASLVAQLVKNLPAIQKTLVQFLGGEDPLEKGQATNASILGFPWWLSQ